MSQTPRFPTPSGWTLLALAAITGCSGGAETPTPDESTPTPDETTAASTPTATAAQTPTATAAQTPTATQAPTPTATQAPTPTATRVPTPVPTPTQPPVPTFKLLRSFPETGAWAVALNRQFVAYYNQPFPQGYDPYTQLSLTLTSGAGAVSAGQASAITEDALGLRYSMNLAAGESYTFDLETAPAVPAADGEYSGWFTTAFPCGLGFDLVDGESRPLTFTQFGSAGNGQLRSLNAGINSVDQDLIVQFVDVDAQDTLPLAAFTAVAGSVNPVDQTNGWVDQTTGLTASVDGCTVGASGNLYCSAPLMVLPLNTGGATGRKELAYIYLRNAIVTGQVSATNGLALTSLNLSGVVSKTDMDYFITNAGTAVGGVLTPIVGNSYDSSYAGEQAISIIITASPLGFTLNDCSI